MKKKYKKAAKTGIAIMGTGVALSIGADVAGEAGATHAATAMGSMGSALVPIGAITGAAMAIGATKELKPKKKRRKSEWEV